MTNEQKAVQFVEELDALRIKYGIADVFFVADANGLIIPGVVGDVKCRTALMKEICLHLTSKVVSICGAESVKAGMRRRHDESWERKNS